MTGIWNDDRITSDFDRHLHQEARRDRESTALLADLWDFIPTMPEFRLYDVRMIGRLRRAGDSKAKRTRFYGRSHVDRLREMKMIERRGDRFLAVHGPDVTSKWDLFLEYRR